ncbi:uncharacterized protein [Mytilus edulis]|uniref:uncharacterized protein n=1 Tax=Mytilus edulis TaxID=6550 RepID=UPI0039F0AAD8
MSWFLAISCVYLVAVTFVSSSRHTQESLLDHLAIDNCDNHAEQPEAVLSPSNTGLRCVTASDEKVSDYTYFDNVRMTVGNTPMYTVFQGLLDFTDNTPRFCFDKDNKLAEFDINFKNNNPLETSRVELTPCRTGGYWTNGKVFCSPPECSKYLRQPKNAEYFEEELHVTMNMKDLNEIPVNGPRGGASMIKYASGSDHRLIYNITSNTTQYLTTDQFFSYCSKFGPCYKGEFLGRTDLLYSHGGWPPMILKRQGDQVLLILRYDPRSFVYREKSPLVSCKRKSENDFELCDSPTGSYSWRKIWKASLPYKKEWLSLRFLTRWSYKHDCLIQVTDTETQEELVNYTGPCGRYADMKLGNYPYAKVGISNKGLSGSVKMRFRDVILIQKGPV